MAEYLGDFAEDATVLIEFNTFSSDDPSASVTITNLVAADIKVHKDGSLTQIVTDGATVVIDFDGITGNHMITIDTSAHADYSVGSEYAVRIEGTTVDAGTINAWIGCFSIENRYNAAAVDLANATDGLGALKAIMDTSGVILKATGLDLVLKTATGMIAVASAVWDRVLTGATHNINNSAGKRLRQVDAAFEVHSGTAQAGTSTTITLDTGAEAIDDIYNGDRCVIVAGTGVEEHGLIKDYNGTTKVATMSKAWVVTPDATSEFVLSPADVDVELWNDETVTGDGDWAAAQADLDTITGTDGAILAPAQGPVVFTGVSNEAGITLIGHGTGAGFKTTGGATGHGLEAIGGATSGDGVNATADGAGNGMDLIGVGGNAGLRTEGGATGAGIHAHGGATGSTPGVEFHAHSTSGDALELEVDGSGDTEATLAAILADTADMQPKLGTPTGLDMSTDIANVQAEADAITVAIAALNDVSVAQINTEMVDVLNVDTYAELSGALAATASLADRIIWTSMMDRNKLMQTATTFTMRNDADGADVATAAVSDDLTTAIRGKLT